MSLELSPRALAVAIAIAVLAALVALAAVGGAGAGDDGRLTAAAPEGKPERTVSLAARIAATATTAWFPPAPTSAAAPAAAPTSEPGAPTATLPRRTAGASTAPETSGPPPSVSSATSPPNPPTSAATVTTISALLPNAADLAAQVLAHHNRERARVGLPPLQRSACLDNVAAVWAARMVATGEMRHNPLAATQSDACMRWAAVGENVGYDGTIEAVQDAWMDSTVHRTNIVNPAFSHVGVGAIRDGNRVWVVVNFAG